MHQGDRRENEERIKTTWVQFHVPETVETVLGHGRVCISAVWPYWLFIDAVAEPNPRIDSDL